MFDTAQQQKRKEKRKERLWITHRDLSGQWTWSIGIVTIQIERIEENGYAKQIQSEIVKLTICGAAVKRRSTLLFFSLTSFCIFWPQPAHKSSFKLFSSD